MPRTALRNDLGKIVYVDSDSVEQDIAERGYTPVSDQDLQAHTAKRQEKEAYSGVAPAIGAATAGALRQASLGASDVLATQLGQLIGGDAARERVADTLTKLKKHQPIATGIGDVAGFALPFLATGGLSGAAEAGGAAALEGAEAAGALTAKGLAKGVLRGVSAPLRVVNAAGEGVEHGLAAALGSKAVVAPMAARAAAEGALLGAGNAVSDNALSQNPELTAEHILPDVLSGALGGLVLGGAAGTVLKGSRALFSKAKPLVKEAVDAATKDVAQSVEEEASLGKESFQAPASAAPEVEVPKATEQKQGREYGGFLPGYELPTRRDPSFLPGYELPEQGLAKALSKKRKLDYTKDAFSLGDATAPATEYPQAEAEALQSKAGEAQRQTRAPIPEEDTTIAGKLKTQADRSLFRALGPTVQHARDLEKYHGGVQAFADDVRELAKGRIKKPLAMAGKEDFAKLGNILDEETAQEYPKMIGELDQLPTESMPKVSDLIDKLKSVRDHIQQKIGQKPEARVLTGYIDDALEKASNHLVELPKDTYSATENMYGKVGEPAIKGRIRFSTLADIRNDFGDIAYPGEKAPAVGSLLHEAEAKLKAVTKGLFFDTADKASETLGEDFVKNYKAVNRKYEVAQQLKKIAAHGATRDIVNQYWSLTDVLAGGAGLAAGPLGAVAGLVGNHLRRHYGDMIASEVLNSASQMLGRGAKVATINQAAQATEKEIQSSIAGFLSPKNAFKPLLYAGASQPVFAGTTQAERQKSFDTYVAELKASVSNPTQQFDAINHRIGDMANITPQTAQHVITKHIAAQNFLASKIPQGTLDSQAIFPNREPARVSDAEMAQFGRYVAVAKQGSRALMQELKSHRVTMETIHGMKAMFPQSYAQIQSELIKHAADQTANMSFQQKMQLYKVFDLPVDRLLNPAAINLMQVTYQRAQNKAGGLTPSGKPRQSHHVPMVSNQMQTTSQSVARGE